MGQLDVYRSLFVEDGDPCLLIDDGVITDINHMASSRLGFQPQEIIGKLAREIFFPSEKDQPDTAPWSRAALLDPSKKEKVDYECLCLPSSGPEFPASIAFSRPGDDDSSIVLARISEKPKLPLNATRLEVGNEVQEESRKLESLGLMAGGLAHDFNNFLLAIMGNADLLDKDLAAGKPGTELLNEIRKATGRAADLCGQMLAYAGKGPTQFQHVDLSMMVREMVPMVKVAVSRNVALRLELADDLPLIDGDLSQIHQVIMNLVVNASESIGNRAGVITIKTGISDCPCLKPDLCLLGRDIYSGQKVFLEVQDDGEGMLPDIKGRIFDPYFSTKVRGRGLGLTTVLGTVRSHQGSLCVSTGPGRGSRVKACLPVTRLKVKPITVRSRQSRDTAGRGKILIVDDEEYLRLLCSRMLQRLGYSVMLAVDGPQALDIYREQREEIEGVILDLEMPVMDGIEVLSKILEFDPAARVIMTSGYHEREIATRFSGRGISGFIQKPYVMSDLGQVLAEIVVPREN